jgi:hypothetical protein
MSDRTPERLRLSRLDVDVRGAASRGNSTLIESSLKSTGMLADLLAWLSDGLSAKRIHRFSALELASANPEADAG